MHCDGCHDINRPHERPSLARLRGQLVGPIRTLEVNATSSYLLNPCWLIMTADIDDRDQCLPGQSSQDKCRRQCDRAPRSSRHTKNSTGWLTYRRPRHCLQGQSIVVIVNVRTDLVRTALLWVVNVMLVDHTGISTDRGDRHIDDRDHCLRGRSIVKS